MEFTPKCPKCPKCGGEMAYAMNTVSEQAVARCTCKNSECDGEADVEGKQSGNIDIRSGRLEL